MNIKEIAEKLNMSEYPFQFNQSDSKEFENEGAVVVFGYSDDGMEFCGAIYEELSAYNGTTAYLDENGLIENECEDEDCPHYKKLLENAITIKQVWCAKDESGSSIASWTYETEIPHETFKIMEDDDCFCIGIVFDINSLKKEV